MGLACSIAKGVHNVQAGAIVETLYRLRIDDFVTLSSLQRRRKVLDKSQVVVNCRASVKVRARQ